MPFNRPALSEIVARIKTDIETMLSAVGATLRNSVVNVLSKVYAGAVHLLYGFLVYISKQIFPDTADENNLLRWASIWGVSQISAEPASGTITVTGTIGTGIPVATILVRSDGVEFIVTVNGTIGGDGTAVVSIDASVAGENGNTDVGVVLNFQTPIAGINSDATVIEVSGGADIEAIDAVRDRLLDRIRRPPMGGAIQDYEAWAKTIAGVTRVWVRPLYFGIGSVGVFFVRDNDVGSIFPSAGEISDVQTYIDTVRPIPANVTVLGPSADTVNFNITLTPSTAEAKAAVTAELTDLFLREGEPGGTLLLSHIQEAISVAADETDHVLNSPTANHVSASGYIPVVGVITWT